MASLAASGPGCYFSMFSLKLVTFNHIFNFFFCFSFFFYRRTWVSIVYLNLYRWNCIFLVHFITEALFRYSISHTIHKIIPLIWWRLAWFSGSWFYNCTRLGAYNSTYEHEFKCLSETHLHSTTSKILIPVKGCKLVYANHPNNIKRGSICFYYKESLPVSVISLTYLNQELFLQITYNSKKVIVFVIYRSPSQNKNEFKLFLSKFEQLLNDVNKRKPSLSVITGDCNARSSSWWANNNNMAERPKLYLYTLANGFSQFINKPTHMKQLFRCVLI